MSTGEYRSLFRVAYIASLVMLVVIPLQIAVFVVGVVRAVPLPAAAKALTAGWQGTAFDTYYVLNAITLLIIALLMFRTPDFSRTTASFGLAAAVLMCIPSTAGMVGLVFLLLSLIPWYIFTWMYVRVFRRLGR